MFSVEIHGKYMWAVDRFRDVIDLEASSVPDEEKEVSVEEIQQKIMRYLRQHKTVSVRPEVLAFELECGSGKTVEDLVPWNNFVTAIQNLVQSTEIIFREKAITINQHDSYFEKAERQNNLKNRKRQAETREP